MNLLAPPMKKAKELVFHFATFPDHDSYQTGDINISLTKESESSKLYRGEYTEAISITLQNAKEVLGKLSSYTDASQ